MFLNYSVYGSVHNDVWDSMRSTTYYSVRFSVDNSICKDVWDAVDQSVYLIIDKRLHNYLRKIS
jgi:hypothetical protein